MPFSAIYMRASTSKQDTRSQEQGLLAWRAAQEAKGTDCRLFRELATGTTFDPKVRTQWARLYWHVERGHVQKIVVWRLDRLGRTAGETICLLDDLEAKRVAFLSLRDGFDLSTPAGRLMRNMLASVAQFETEVRSERQRAGIAAAREANGGKCPWGGRDFGYNKCTKPKIPVVLQLKAEGRSIVDIAQVVELSRPTVYRIIREKGSPQPQPKRRRKAKPRAAAAHPAPVNGDQ
jgi:DNA invertase Pin-like site-specific DNA recombinase